MNLRVLHYAPALHHSGGLRTYVLSLAAEQRARGVDVIVASANGTTGDEHLVGTLANIAQNQRPDVVHLHGGELFDGSEWIDLPTVSTIHGHDLYCPSGSKWSQSLGACGHPPSISECTVSILRYKCGSRRPNAMVSNFQHLARVREQRHKAHQHCVSQYVQNCLRESGYRPSAGTSVIYAAVPRPTAREAVEDIGNYDAIYVGRVEPNKGVEVLLRASALARTRPRLAVIGHGTDVAKLKNLARDLGISRRTDFLGWRSQAEIAAMHSSRTVLAVPSQWPEPAGMVVMEAAARGRACLVSGRGGLPELVASVDQVVAEASSAQSWATALDKALTTVGWLESRGQAAQEKWAKYFDPDVVVSAFSEIYASVQK